MTPPTESDLELKARIKRRSGPIRPLSYEEQALKRERQADRETARKHLKQAQEKFRDPHTVQKPLDGGDKNAV